MKLAVVGSSPFSYVIKQYLENVKKVPTSVIGKTPKGQLKFFFWADTDDDKDVIRQGLSEAGIPYEEMPFPSAVLYQGELLEELTDEAEEAFYQKTNTDIQFVGSNVSNFFITTPEDPSEWILGETDSIRKEDDTWKIKLLGIDIDAEQLAATIPLPILANIMGLRIRTARVFLYRSIVVDDLPFDPKVPYSIVWDVDTEGVYRWVKHGGEWYKEEFSFRKLEGKNGFPHVRHPLRLTSFAGVKLFGPFAQWDPKAGLASVLRRLEKEF